MVHRIDGGTREWNVSFVRNFNDWEVEIVVSFLNLLNSHVPSRDDADVWREHNRRIFMIWSVPRVSF